MALDVRKLVATITCSAALWAPAAANAAVQELGATNPSPPASCPTDCTALGRVSGYQERQGAVKNPFRATRRGKIVAFTITLGKPSADEITFFRRTFGGPARARLSVLAPVPRRKGHPRRRHRLTGQSEVFELEDYLGSSPTFALSRPLTLKKGYTLGLTVPTWAPAFAVNLGPAEAWRSSRDPANCDDLRQNAAQQKRGGLRTYGCFYRTARMLYTATFVPDPKPTTPSKKR